MAVLAPALRSRPVAEPPEREVLRRILPGLRLSQLIRSANCLMTMPYGFGTPSRSVGEPVPIGEVC